MRYQIRFAQDLLVMIGLLFLCFAFSQAQTIDPETGRVSKGSKGVRSVTVPVTTRNKLKQHVEEGQNVDLALREDGEEQQVLAIRGIGSTPLSLAILVQDDVVSGVGNDIKLIHDFIRTLPRGSRVMVGYMRAGSLDVRQKFTSDLDRASRSLRIPVSSPTAAPLNPYIGILECLKRFDALPTGRRAILVVSDGLDIRAGLDNSSPGLSVDLQRAINDAQRRGVAVYSIYTPTVTGSILRNSVVVANGQGGLARLADETGGRSYNHGLAAPVSFSPYLNDLGETLLRQFAITYLSTHPSRGFHKIDIKTSRADIALEYPHGYTN
jgi:VWFA-related protein